MEKEEQGPDLTKKELPHNYIYIYMYIYMCIYIYRVPVHVEQNTLQQYTCLNPSLFFRTL